MRGNSTLYHYSPMCFLPTVLREGLWKGDVAHHDIRVQLTAVSLTTQTDPDRLSCWGQRDALSFKTAVRYVCHLRDEDLPKLEAQRETWKRLRFSREYMRSLDPYGQAKWWYHFFGKIPREQFEVQLRGRSGYVTPPEAGLGRVSALVDEEHANYEFLSPLHAPGCMFVRHLSDSQDQWLFTECYPAERFAIA